MEGVYAQNPGSGSMSDMAMLRHSVCDERPVPNARTGRTDSCRPLFSTSKIGLGNNPLLFTGLTLTFLKQFGVGVWLTLPLLSSLALGIILLGQAVGKKEGWPRFDSLYWSFHHSNHSWIRRYSTHQTKIKDYCDLDCFLGVTAKRHHHCGRCTSRDRGSANLRCPTLVADSNFKEGQPFWAYPFSAREKIPALTPGGTEKQAPEVGSPHLLNGKFLPRQ